jgi:hypothetical protein
MAMAFTKNSFGIIKKRRKDWQGKAFHQEAERSKSFCIAGNEDLYVPVDLSGWSSGPYGQDRDFGWHTKSNRQNTCAQACAHEQVPPPLHDVTGGKTFSILRRYHRPANEGDMHLASMRMARDGECHP